MYVEALVGLAKLQRDAAVHAAEVMAAVDPALDTAATKVGPPAPRAGPALVSPSLVPVLYSCRR